MPLQLTRLQTDGEADNSRIEYGVTYIAAGEVGRRDGKRSHWVILPEALRGSTPLWGGLAVFIDHASLATLFYPQLKDAAGVTFEPRWNEAERRIDGGVRLSNRPDLEWFRFFLQEFWEDQQAGREVPNVGLSGVIPGNKHRFVEQGENEPRRREMFEITKVESVDFVFGPGAEGRVRSVLNLLGQSVFAFRSGGVQMDPCENCGQVGAACRCSGGAEEQGGGQQGAGSGEQVATAPAAPPAPQRGESGGQVPAPAVQRQEAVAPPQSPPQGGGGQVVLPQGGGQNGHQNGQDALLRRVDELQQAVSSLGATMERLSGALARAEEPGVVEGMGTAPRQSGAIQSMLTGLDRFAPAVDWLFGVEGAALPDPQFRSPAMIYQALTGDSNWRGVFDGEMVMLAGATTATLPGLAVNAMNKVIQQLWASNTLRSYRWYELVVALAPNDGSTHDMQWLGYGGIGELPVVPEKGSYTELDVADTKESDAFTKYGGYVGISLEMFRKSDIQRIQLVPRALTRSAVMTRSAKFASIFTSNSGVGPTLDQDGKALFHADHSNVATTAFGSDSTAWNAVDLEIWGHTEIGSGKVLAISPKYMLCRRDLFRSALVVFGYGDGQPTTYVPEAVDRGPDDPRPWPITVPDFTDTNDWAAIVDPRLYPVIMASYAQQGSGSTHPLPEVFSVVSPTAGLVFTNDEFPVKVRDWFAYGVNGYRGVSKRNVA